MEEIQVYSTIGSRPSKKKDTPKNKKSQINKTEQMMVFCQHFKYQSAGKMAVLFFCAFKPDM